MSERRRIQTALLSCLLVIGTTPAWGSGPSGSGCVLSDYKICKGGPSKGAHCMFDVDCPSSNRVLDWLTGGGGATLPATITAFMDDEVRDFFGSADTNDQAIAIIDLARLPPTKVSVIAAAPKNRQYSDHDGLDPVGTSMKCRLKIRFLNEP